MARRIDPRIKNNHVDANFFDRLNDGHDAAVDEMISLHRSGVIGLMIPYSVKSELENPDTPADVKARMSGIVFSEPVQLTPGELKEHQEVRNLVRGNARPGKHDMDAFHVVEAAKHGGGYFVTRDHRLLRKAVELEDMLHIKVVTPSDFMAFYRAFESSGR